MNHGRSTGHDINKETAKIHGELSAKILDKFGPKDKQKKSKFKLKDAGIGLNDLWIACTAIQHSLILVSQDRDFNRISEVIPLKIECWK